MLNAYWKDFHRICNVFRGLVLSKVSRPPSGKDPCGLKEWVPEAKHSPRLFLLQPEA